MKRKVKNASTAVRRRGGKKKTVSKAKAKAKPAKITKVKRKALGKIDHYFDNIKVAAMTLGGVLEIGDVIQIEGGNLVHEQEIVSMQIDHAPVQKAKKGDEIGFKVGKKVREGYRVFKK